MKWNILRRLDAHGCDVRVFPATRRRGAAGDRARRRLPEQRPRRSGGADLRHRQRHGSWSTPDVPMFGICLGHQILGLAHGRQDFKLKFGHRGAQSSGEGAATRARSRSPRRTTASPSIPTRCRRTSTVTHLNLYDGTVEGLRHTDKPIFSVQYHPEASPGPHDADYCSSSSSSRWKRDRGESTRRSRALRLSAPSTVNAQTHRHRSASSSSARARSSSARRASSTTRARRPARRCAPKGSRSCWSTATRRRS